MRPLLVVLVLTAGVSPAAAQSGASERTAFRVALWGTVVPVAAGAVWWISQGGYSPRDPSSVAPVRAGPSFVMASGFILGPALGYQSAGLGMRGVFKRSGLTLLSFIPAMAICGWDCSTGDDAYNVAWLVIATGSGLSAASAIYDIARVKHNVRRRRATTDSPGGVGGVAFSVTPTYTPGRRALGVQVGIQF